MKLISLFEKMVHHGLCLSIVVLAVWFQAGHQFYMGSDVASQPSLFTEGGPHVSPYTVAIIRNRDWHDRCAGVLVSNSYVLTAAQCVDCEFAELILGAYDILGQEKTQIHQFINQNNVIFHPLYDSRTLDNDIALIRLPQSVQLTLFVNVAGLPEPNVELHYGTYANVTGWENRLTGYSNILSQARLTILSKDKCKSFWPAARIDNNKFCASNSLKQAHLPRLLGANCIIDPGSPLTLHGDPDKVIGILTEHAKCGSLLPEIFINVASYRYWIDEILGRTLLNINIDAIPSVVTSVRPAQVSENVDIIRNDQPLDIINSEFEYTNIISPQLELPSSILESNTDVNVGVDVSNYGVKNTDYLLPTEELDIISSELDNTNIDVQQGTSVVTGELSPTYIINPVLELPRLVVDSSSNTNVDINVDVDKGSIYEDKNSDYLLAGEQLDIINSQVDNTNVDIGVGVNLENEEYVKQPNADLVTVGESSLTNINNIDQGLPSLVEESISDTDVHVAADVDEGASAEENISDYLLPDQYLDIVNYPFDSAHIDIDSSADLEHDQLDQFNSEVISDDEASLVSIINPELELPTLVADSHSGTYANVAVNTLDLEHNYELINSDYLPSGQQIDITNSQIDNIDIGIDSGVDANQIEYLNPHNSDLTVVGVTNIINPELALPSLIEESISDADVNVAIDVDEEFSVEDYISDYVLPDQHLDIVNYPSDSAHIDIDSSANLVHHQLDQFNSEVISDDEASLVSIINPELELPTLVADSDSGIYANVAVNTLDLEHNYELINSDYLPSGQQIDITNSQIDNIDIGIDSGVDVNQIEYLNPHNSDLTVVGVTNIINPELALPSLIEESISDTDVNVAVDVDEESSVEDYISDYVLPDQHLDIVNYPSDSAHIDIDSSANLVHNQLDQFNSEVISDDEASLVSIINPELELPTLVADSDSGTYANVAVNTLDLEHNYELINSDYLPSGQQIDITNSQIDNIDIGIDSGVDVNQIEYLNPHNSDLTVVGVTNIINPELALPSLIEESISDTDVNVAVDVDEESSVEDYISDYVLPDQHLDIVNYPSDSAHIDIDSSADLEHDQLDQFNSELISADEASLLSIINPELELPTLVADSDSGTYANVAVNTLDLEHNYELINSDYLPSDQQIDISNSQIDNINIGVDAGVDINQIEYLNPHNSDSTGVGESSPTNIINPELVLPFLAEESISDTDVHVAVDEGSSIEEYISDYLLPDEHLDIVNYQSDSAHIGIDSSADLEYDQLNQFNSQVISADDSSLVNIINPELELPTLVTDSNSGTYANIAVNTDLEHDYVLTYSDYALPGQSLDIVNPRPDNININTDANVDVKQIEYLNPHNSDLTPDGDSLLTNIVNPELPLQPLVEESISDTFANVAVGAGLEHNYELTNSALLSGQQIDISNSQLDNINIDIGTATGAIQTDYLNTHNSFDNSLGSDIYVNVDAKSNAMDQFVYDSDIHGNPQQLYWDNVNKQIYNTESEYTNIVSPADNSGVELGLGLNSFQNSAGYSYLQVNSLGNIKSDNVNADVDINTRSNYSVDDELIPIILPESDDKTVHNKKVRMQDAIITFEIKGSDLDIDEKWLEDGKITIDELPLFLHKNAVINSKVELLPFYEIDVES